MNRKRAVRTLRQVLGDIRNHGPMRWAVALQDIVRDLEGDPMAPTVTVRVAVCVEADGTWAAHGASGITDAGAMHVAHYEPGDAVSWLTAQVPLPEPARVIEAEVEDE